MSLFTSFENLETMTDDITTDDNALSLMEAELESTKADAEIAKLMVDFKELEHENEMVNLAYEMLENTSMVMENYGLCKGFVQLVDPDGSMQEAGIFPAIDTLNDVPTKDESVVVAMEGFKDTMKKVWEKIKAFFKKIWDFIKNITNKVLGKFQASEKVYASLLKQVKDVSEIDEEKWKKKKLSKILKNSSKDYVTDTTALLDDLISSVTEKATELKVIYKQAPKTETTTAADVTQAGLIFPQLNSTLLQKLTGSTLNQIRKEVVAEDKHKKTYDFPNDRHGKILGFKKVVISSSASGDTLSITTKSSTDVKSFSTTSADEVYSHSAALSAVENNMKAIKKAITNGSKVKGYQKVREVQAKEVDSLIRKLETMKEEEDITKLAIKKINIIKACVSFEDKVGIKIQSFMTQHINALFDMVRAVIASKKS